MIVISGALVLVALILLIIGVVGPDLTFVYASIGVSLVSLVFLIIGIVQRRGETASSSDTTAAPKGEGAKGAKDDEDAGSDQDDAVTAVIPAQPRGGSKKVAPVVEEPPVAETADEELEYGGTVLVVEGRPRYHVEGCRYLTGKEAEEVDVLDAREEGFTPCGVCKPDEVLEAEEYEDEEYEDEEYEDEEYEDDLADEPAAAQDEPAGEEELVEEDVPGVEIPVPARRSSTRGRTAAESPAAAAKKAAAKKAPAKAPAKAAAVTPAKTAAVTPAKTAAVTPARTAKAPAKTAKAPSKAARAATASTPAASAAAGKAGSVVVIPDRGKFHRAECRYVRDVPEAETLSKSAASKQGYAACGVCKP